MLTYTHGTSSITWYVYRFELNHQNETQPPLLCACKQGKGKTPSNAAPELDDADDDIALLLLLFMGSVCCVCSGVAKLLRLVIHTRAYDVCNTCVRKTPLKCFSVLQCATFYANLSAQCSADSRANRIRVADTVCAACGMVMGNLGPLSYNIYDADQIFSQETSKHLFIVFCECVLACVFVLAKCETVWVWCRQLVSQAVTASNANGSQIKIE